MTPLTKAIVQMLVHATETEGAATAEYQYLFIQEHLLKKDNELYNYLSEAGIQEEYMAKFVLQQFYRCRW